MNLSAREMRLEDIKLICRYWVESDPAHLQAMGVDLAKMPTREQFTSMMEQQFHLPVEKKISFCTIWEADGEPVGHCNTNPTNYGDYAYMHLHLWNNAVRQKGMGAELVKKSLGIFFDTLQLETIYCEPYALNPAPNKTLAKVGFRLLKEYVTSPGPLNFEQPVKLWQITRQNFSTS